MSEGPLVRSLAELPADEWYAHVLGLVVAETAALLGTRPEEVDPERAYSDYGYNSLAAVALTSKLEEVTGLELPLTMLFDHPNPDAVARNLIAEAGGGAEPGGTGRGVGGAAVVEQASPRPDTAEPGPGPADDPIAIVGMACRYPGGVESPVDLWDLVAAGRDGVSEFPADRGWDLERMLSSEPGPGTSTARGGGFLAGAADFDPEFFGISPREALAMDPQQRLFLRTAWESCESANIDPHSLKGTATGVFAGISTHEYSELPRSAELEGYWGVGNAASVCSGRVSYVLGLVGPAVSVDTACSSSLVGLHWAIGALRSGECSLALAGGVSVLASGSLFVEFSRQGGLSADGRCRSFARSADGTGWAEGVGVLVLERLSDARRNGRRVLGLVRGSGVNQDGASNGLTAPSGSSQERVIRAAWADSGVAAGGVDAVEGHGTGTVLGDPIEVSALAATYGREREQRPLRLGSLKSNVGHAQAAAGVGGVIKMVQALRYGLLPASLHVDEPTPKVDWTGSGVELLTEPVPWPRGERVRRAGVSAFGVSGTNAHVILEEAPADCAGPEPGSAQSGADSAVGGPDSGSGASAAAPEPLAWVVSAKTPAALHEQVGRLHRHLLAHPGLAAPDVAHTLAGRARFAHRAVFTGAGRAELISRLESWLSGGTPDRTATAATPPPGKVAFVFPGQGSQWAGMAVELLGTEPVFAAELHAFAAELEPHVDWSLLDVLRGVPGAPGYERVDVVQPALFGVMISLAALWRSRGVHPDVVVGHSQGEIAAAYVAGGLSLADAARVVALRSRALVELPGAGGMASVALAGDALRELLAPWGAALSVAAENSPSAATVAGDSAAVDELLERCSAEQVWARRIAVDYASHSAHVEGIREQLAELLAPIEPRSGRIRFHSTVDDEQLDTARLDSGYWYRNLRHQVRFGSAVRALVEQGCRTFVEISAHPVLGVPLEQIAESVTGEPDAVTVVGSLRRDDGGPARFTAALAEVHARGLPVDWTPNLAGGRWCDLPTYAFQEQRYWPSRAASGAGDVSAAGLSSVDHPVLGAAVPVAGGPDRVLTGRLDVREHPWLADHAVRGSVLLPGVAFLELVATAARTVGCELIEELTLQAPLVLPADGPVLLQVVVQEPDERGARAIGVHARGADVEEDWTRHAAGTISAESGDRPPAPTPSWPPADGRALDVAELYDELADRGLNYGPAFRGVQAAWRSGEEQLAEISFDTAPEGRAEGFALHPALLDASFHAAMAVLTEGDGPDEVSLPFSWSGVRLRGGADALRVRIVPSGPDAVGVLAVDEAGEPAFSVDSASVRKAPIAALAGTAPEGFFGLTWRPAEIGATAARCAVLGEGLDELPGERFADLGELFATGSAPGPVIAPISTGGADPGDARRLVHEAVSLIRDWLADERGVPLVFATARAVGASEDEAPEVAAAPVWGLVRAAQAEHPGRFVLLDHDGTGESLRAVPAALAFAQQTGEPQLVLRDGEVRTARVAPESVPLDRAELDPAGTVLITGGTTGIGALAARRLVTEHGVRHLLLVSRRGPAAAGSAELVDELAGLGAEAAVVACDAADRDQLAALLAGIDPAHPLTGVVHSAGVLDDGLLTALTAEQIDRVLTPKIAAAAHLHELTAELPVRAFVLFSSVAGVVGGPGQANYAAGNAFLDALAHARRAAGLPAVSMAWGLWEQDSELTGHLGSTDLARIAGSGVAAMSGQEALRLFDAALTAPAPLAVLARLDRRALRTAARAGSLPRVLSDLVPAAARRAGRSLLLRLSEVDDPEREDVLLEAVRAEAAAVLGHPDAAAVDPRSAFKELGFDSLCAVQLRNRLNAATGLALPPTLVFDHPNAAAVAAHLAGLLGQDRPAGRSAVDAELDRLAELLRSLPADERDPAAARLRTLLTTLDGTGGTGEQLGDRIRSGSAEEIFDLIDNELGMR